MTEKQTNIITIDSNQSDQRFDRFLRKYFRSNPEIKLKDIYTWIRKWYIKCNQQKRPENYILKLWDEIMFDDRVISNISSDIQWSYRIDISDHQKIQNLMNKRWYNLEDLIIYEDNQWIVRNKPADIVIHSGNKHMDDITMNDLLDYHLDINSNLSNRNRYNDKDMITDRETFVPSYWYRLDKDTSWVLIWAKEYDSLRYLNEIIRNKTDIEKYYIAIVYGKIVEKKFDIKLPLFKWYNAKYGRAQSFVNFEKWLPCKTSVKLIQSIEDDKLGSISLVRCQIHTGKMHQIRIHLSHIWYPILWDIMYWDDIINKKLHKHYKINRQLLHSWKYSFIDQEDSSRTFQAPIPDDFMKFDFDFDMVK